MRRMLCRVVLAMASVAGGVSMPSIAWTALEPPEREDRFVIHAGDASETELGLLKRRLGESYSLIRSVLCAAGFDWREPERPLIWHRFETETAYRRYCRTAEGLELHSFDSFYSASTNVVVWLAHESADPDSAHSERERRLISHEAAHQIAFNCGILRRGVVYPFWVSEGLATSFEYTGPEAPQSLPPNPARRAGILRQLASGSLLPVDRFLLLTQVPPSLYAKTSDLYDQAWALFRFLLHEHPQALRAYLEELSLNAWIPPTDEKQRAAFERAFGDIGAIEVEWRVYLEHLYQESGRPRVLVP